MMSATFSGFRVEGDLKSWGGRSRMQLSGDSW